jgi:hypothetical protein
LSPRGSVNRREYSRAEGVDGDFYRGWLADERALAAESVRCYSCQAKTVLRWLPEPLDDALAQLDPPTVTTFIVEQSAVAGSVRSAKAL